MSAKDNIHSIDEYKKGESLNLDANLAEEIMAKSARDFGKAAMFISILAVVLLSIVFFSMNQNVTGLSEQVKGLSGLKNDVAAMGAKVGGMEQQLAAMPAAMKKVVINETLADMRGKLDYLGTQVGPQQTEALAQAKALLEQVQAANK